MDQAQESRRMLFLSQNLRELYIEDGINGAFFLRLQMHKN